MAVNLNFTVKTLKCTREGEHRNMILEGRWRPDFENSVLYGR